MGHPVCVINNNMYVTNSITLIIFALMPFQVAEGYRLRVCPNFGFFSMFHSLTDASKIFSCWNALSMIINPLVMTYECGFEYDQTFLCNTLRLCLNQHSLVNSKIRTHLNFDFRNHWKVYCRAYEWLLNARNVYKGMKGKFIEGPTE